MDHHEAAAADIAGARISDREREADRHRGVNRIAAAIENFDADAGGALLLRHHHAVAREDRLRRRDRWRARNRRDLGERRDGEDEGDEGEKNSSHQPFCPFVLAQAGDQLHLARIAWL